MKHPSIKGIMKMSLMGHVLGNISFEIESPSSRDHLFARSSQSKLEEVKPTHDSDFEILFVSFHDSSQWSHHIDRSQSERAYLKMLWAFDCYPLNARIHLQNEQPHLNKNLPNVEEDIALLCMPGYLTLLMMMSLGSTFLTGKTTWPKSTFRTKPS